jgi:DNA-directed RNA polymerase subunit M/transcription elongation factor TFIIS
MCPYKSPQNRKIRCRHIHIDELVRTAKSKIKEQLVSSLLESQGHRIEITTSRSAFQGNRLWFVCPSCQKRKAILYESRHGELLCWKCLKASSTSE